jgi:hypothetical protein
MLFYCIIICCLFSCICPRYLRCISKYQKENERSSEKSNEIEYISDNEDNPIIITLNAVTPKINNKDLSTPLVSQNNPPEYDKIINCTLSRSI